MFDFEKLEVYQVTKIQNFEVLKFLIETPNFNSEIASQWKDASMGSVLNLAESTARMSHADKRHYLTIARGNINVCVALIELAKEMEWLDTEKHQAFYSRYEQMSKMMLGMIRSFSNESKL